MHPSGNSLLPSSSHSLVKISWSTCPGMTLAMTATGGLLGLVVLVGLLGGLWLRGWVERRQQRPVSTEPETSAATRAAVAG